MGVYAYMRDNRPKRGIDWPPPSDQFPKMHNPEADAPPSQPQSIVELLEEIRDILVDVKGALCR